MNYLLHETAYKDHIITECLASWVSSECVKHLKFLYYMTSKKSGI